jgi:hypothetical protein
VLTILASLGVDYSHYATAGAQEEFAGHLIPPPTPEDSSAAQGTKTTSSIPRLCATDVRDEPIDWIMPGRLARKEITGTFRHR